MGQIKYKKIHAVYFVHELEHFYLVDIFAPGGGRYDLFVEIPKINQIETILGIAHANNSPWRTTLEKLPSKYSCPISIITLSKHEALNMFPYIKDQKIIVGMKEKI